MPVTRLGVSSLDLGASARTAPASRSLRAAYRDLGTAQKFAARSAPAYSRFVNRRLGRALAALCVVIGLAPNAVTAISAGFTFSAMALLALNPPSVQLGVVVALLLLVGYGFDSADGQVARFSGAGSVAGEWLDHVVDAAKASALPLALAIGLYRADAVDATWLLIPVVGSVVGAVLFFTMILTEQLRRSHSVAAPSAAKGRGLTRSLLALPMDYGVLCLSFALLGALPVFLVVYTGLLAATCVFLALALGKWFSELQQIDREESP